MKKLLFAISLVVITAAACKKDEPEQEGVLTVSPTNKDIGSGSGVFYIEVESNTDWTIYPANGIDPIQSLDVTPLSGSGNASVKVSYGSQSVSGEYASIYFKYTSLGVEKSVYTLVHR